MIPDPDDDDGMPGWHGDKEREKQRAARHKPKPKAMPETLRLLLAGMNDHDRLLLATWAEDRAYWSAKQCPDCKGWVHAVDVQRRCLTCRPVKRLAYDSDKLLAVTVWRHAVFSRLRLDRMVKDNATRVMLQYKRGLSPEVAITYAFNSPQFHRMGLLK